MSALIDVLRRDPEIIGVAEGLGIELDDYVAMVAEFIEHPDREVQVTIVDDEPEAEIEVVAAWFRRRLAATFGDTFTRATKPKRMW